MKQLETADDGQYYKDEDHHREFIPHEEYIEDDEEDPHANDAFDYGQRRVAV